MILIKHISIIPKSSISFLLKVVFSIDLHRSTLIVFTPQVPNINSPSVPDLLLWRCNRFTLWLNRILFLFHNAMHVLDTLFGLGDLNDIIFFKGSISHQSHHFGLFLFISCEFPIYLHLDPIVPGNSSPHYSALNEYSVVDVFEVSC